MKILRNDWKDAQNAAIFREDYELISNLSIAITYVVFKLTEHNLPFRLMNLGGGVKKITRKMDTCPKCHGTGKI